jgi:hypothetical protein
MPVNYSTYFDRHNTRLKCGIITSAKIDGADLKIKGYLFAADVPDVIRRLESDDEFGFSFDAKDVGIADINADVWMATNIPFTGATVILKSKAAYRDTSFKFI